MSQFISQLPPLYADPRGLDSVQRLLVVALPPPHTVFFPLFIVSAASPPQPMSPMPFINLYPLMYSLLLIRRIVVEFLPQPISLPSTHFLLPSVHPLVVISNLFHAINIVNSQPDPSQRESRMLSPTAPAHGPIIAIQQAPLPPHHALITIPIACRAVTKAIFPTSFNPIVIMHLFGQPPIPLLPVVFIS